MVAVEMIDPLLVVSVRDFGQKRSPAGAKATTAGLPRSGYQTGSFASKLGGDLLATNMIHFTGPRLESQGRCFFSFFHGRSANCIP